MVTSEGNGCARTYARERAKNRTNDLASHFGGPGGLFDVAALRNCVKRTRSPAEGYPLVKRGGELTQWLWYRPAVLPTPEGAMDEFVVPLTRPPTDTTTAPSFATLSGLERPRPRKPLPAL